MGEPSGLYPSSIAPRRSSNGFVNPKFALTLLHKYIRFIVYLLSILLLILVGMLLAGRMAQEGSNLMADDPALLGVGLPRPLVRTPFIPKELYFAGERIPLEKADVYEALQWEMGVMANWHSSILMILKRSGRYFPIIDSILAAQNVPADIRYVAVAESSLNPRAISPSNAVGLWQFIKTTGQEYGLRVDSQIDERYHTQKATEAACRFLQKSHDEFGSWTAAAASYNMGQNGYRRRTKEQGTTDYFDLHLNTETSRYIYRILALKLVLEQPTIYGFSVPEAQKFKPLPHKNITITESVTDLAALAAQNGTSYKVLRWLNPWIMSTSLTLSPGDSLTLKIMTEEQRTTLYAPVTH